jgi:hypothetical protein
MSGWNRDKTLDVFQKQLYSLQSRIVRNLSRYLLEVEVKGVRYIALIEGSSHEYHVHRIDLLPEAEQIELVICHRHNSCLPKRVLELASPRGREYEAFKTPSWFDFEQRSGRAWAQVFVGALLSGHGDAYQILEQIHEEAPRAYYRYQAKMAQLAAHKQGRPVAV